MIKTLFDHPKTTIGGVASLFTAIGMALTSYAHGQPLDWPSIGPLLSAAWIGITASDAK